MNELTLDDENKETIFQLSGRLIGEELRKRQDNCIKEILEEAAHEIDRERTEK